MKPEHKNLTPLEKALLTWYEPDNPKYKDPLHPTIKLAGEVGELLDLWAKNEFKPGFDWMGCKWCGKLKGEHFVDKCTIGKHFIGTKYVPKVLDELGDIWYYLRILAWQYNITLSVSNWSQEVNDNLSIIREMYRQASQFMEYKDTRVIEVIFYFLLDLLANLDYTIDQLTELNYQKLNSEPSNHGWKDAV